MEHETFVSGQSSAPQAMRPVQTGEQAGTLNVPSKSLYISHFMSTWVSRGFEFGSTLFLVSIYPNTLLPMSIYALVRAASAIVLSSALGRFIDRTERLQVIRYSIIGQRLSVTLSCIAFLAQLFRYVEAGSVQDIVIFSALVLLACLEKLCSIMNTISVERDWVIVISETNETTLREMNTQMRRIDLFCKLWSPLFISILHGFSSSVAIITMLSMSTLFMMPEYFLIAWVYSNTPQLGQTHHPPEILEPETTAERNWLRSWMCSSSLYIHSPAFSPSFSLSLLYLTVLSFSGQMITYLLSLHVPKFNSWHIGALRTVSTMFEISSTFIAPFLMTKIGAIRTGIWSLSWQCIWLTLSITTFWSFNIPALFRTYVFVGGVILSRVGLWSFDLSTQLLVQNSVNAGQRGSFSATESSVQNWFELCTFAMTIVWSRPEQFKYPATVSLFAVYAAVGFYARFVRIERGHLVHVPTCCKGVTRYDSVRTSDEDEEMELGAY